MASVLLDVKAQKSLETTSEEAVVTRAVRTLADERPDKWPASIEPLKRSHFMASCSTELVLKP